jgi:hypothetical protein
MRPPSSPLIAIDTHNPGSSYIAADLARWLDGQNIEHLRSAPYPMTQGKIERWHQTLKNRILFGKLLPARRSRSPDRSLRCRLQPPPIPREHRQSHPGRRLLRAGSRGHVRQAGGDSRLKLRRHGCDGAGVESHLRSVHSKGARSTARRIMLRPERRYQALRLRRTAVRLRGLTAALRPSVGHPCRSTAQWIA